jgi:hypothetical protein
VRRDLVHMGTNAPSTFRILKILKSYTSLSLKNLALNTEIDIFRRSVCKKVPLKNILYFGRYKKTNF